MGFFKRGGKTLPVDDTASVSCDVTQKIESDGLSANRNQASARQELLASFKFWHWFSPAKGREEPSPSSTATFIRRISAIDTSAPLNNVSQVCEFRNKIAEGGQAEIWKAFDKSLFREIAVKSFHPPAESKHREMHREYFVAEARIVAQLDHPGIVPLYGLFGGDSPDELHLAMKLVQGVTLREHVRQLRKNYETCPERLTEEAGELDRRLQFFLRICEAVAYAHDKGVVHCDLKPENIMLSETGQIFVMDWGIARLYSPAMAQSREPTRRLEGTPRYIAPELIAGCSQSPASDIFALGMIFFELVTLERAVEGDNSKQVLGNIASGQFRPFRHHFRKVRPAKDLAAIFGKATAADPAARYASVQELQHDVESYRLKQEVRANPDNWVRRSYRYLAFHRSLGIGLILSVCLIVLAMVAFGLWREVDRAHAAQLREKQLSVIQAGVHQRASRIDREFLALATSLNGISLFAEAALRRAEDSDESGKGEKLYFHSDFDSKESAPSDLTYSEYYRRQLSLAHPGVKLAPGVSRHGVRATLEKLSQLGPFFRMAMANSDYQSNRAISDADILRGGTVISGFFVGTADGVFMSYPGNNYYAADFDPRERPWFKSGMNYAVPTWGMPYFSGSGMGVVFACLRRLDGPDGKPAAVIGLEVSGDKISGPLLGEALPGVIGRYLVAPDGRLVMDGGRLVAGEKRGDASGFVRLEPFRYSVDFLRLISGSPGGGIVQAGQVLLAADYIPSLQLYYVEAIRDDSASPSLRQ